MHCHPPSFDQMILNFGSTLESPELLKNWCAGHIPGQIHQKWGGGGEVEEGTGYEREEPGHYHMHSNMQPRWRTTVLDVCMYADRPKFKRVWQTLLVNQPSCWMTLLGLVLWGGNYFLKSLSRQPSYFRGKLNIRWMGFIILKSSLKWTSKKKTFLTQLTYTERLPKPRSYLSQNLIWNRIK